MYVNITSIRQQTYKILVQVEQIYEIIKAVLLLYLKHKVSTVNNEHYSCFIRNH